MNTIKRLSKLNLSEDQMVELFGEDMSLLLDLSKKITELDSSTRNIYDTLDNNFSEFMDSEEGEQMIQNFLDSKGVKKPTEKEKFEAESLEQKFKPKDEEDVDWDDFEYEVESKTPLDIGGFGDEEVDWGDDDEDDWGDDEVEEEPTQKPSETPDDDEDDEDDWSKDDDEPSETPDDEVISPVVVEKEDEVEVMPEYKYSGYWAKINFDGRIVDALMAYSVFMAREYGIVAELSSYYHPNKKSVDSNSYVMHKQGNPVLLTFVGGFDVSDNVTLFIQMYAPSERLIKSFNNILSAMRRISQARDWTGFYGTKYQQIDNLTEVYYNISVTNQHDVMVDSDNLYEIVIDSNVAGEPFHNHKISSISRGLSSSVNTNLVSSDSNERAGYLSNIYSFFSMGETYEGLPADFINELKSKSEYSNLANTFTFVEGSTPVSYVMYDTNSMYDNQEIQLYPSFISLNNGALNFVQGYVKNKKGDILFADSGMNLRDIPNGQNKSVQDLATDTLEYVQQKIQGWYDKSVEKAIPCNIAGDNLSEKALSLTQFGLKSFYIQDSDKFPTGTITTNIPRVFVDLAVFNKLCYNKQKPLNFKVTEDLKFLLIFTPQKLVAYIQTIEIEEVDSLYDDAITKDNYLKAKSFVNVMLPTYSTPHNYQGSFVSSSGITIQSPPKKKDSKEDKLEKLEKNLAKYNKLLSILEKRPKNDKTTSRIDVIKKKKKFTEMFIKKHKK
jgi:hypothetical protein